MALDVGAAFSSLSEVCSSARLPSLAFSPRAIPLPLSSGDRDHFSREGWCGPYTLLASRGLTQLERVHYEIDQYFTSAAEMTSATSEDAFETRPWFKSLHVYVPAIHDVVTHPALVHRVVSLLGKDVIVWGAFLKLLQAANGHRWHRDVEHLRGDGITAYLGINRLNSLSTLKAVTRTHRHSHAPQDRSVKSDEDALREASSEVPNPKLIRMPVSDGTFVLFDGKLWHGSQNSDEHDRLALIIQYSRPDVKIRIPLTWQTEVTWHDTPPPCVLVSGADKWNHNRIVTPHFS